MKEKGFTLIELLAVIVILAIIALIASPIIIGLIDDARKEAFKSSAYGIVKAGEMLYSKDLLNSIKEEVQFTYTGGVESSSIDKKKLEYNGTKPKNGNVVIDTNGKVAIAIHNGKWCAKKDYNESVITLTKTTKEDCTIDTGSSINFIKIVPGRNFSLLLTDTGDVYMESFNNLSGQHLLMAINVPTGATPADAAKFIFNIAPYDQNEITESQFDQLLDEELDFLIISHIVYDNPDDWFDDPYSLIYPLFNLQYDNPEEFAEFINGLKNDAVFMSFTQDVRDELYDLVFSQPNNGETVIKKVNIQGVKDIVNVEDRTTLFTMNNGKVFAIGEDPGLESGIRAVKITEIPGITNAKKVVSGGSEKYILLENGDVYGWGYNYNGILGNGNEDSTYAPEKIDTLSNVKDLIINEDTRFALLNDGTVKGWGWTQWGQVPITGAGAFISTPTMIPGLTNVKKVYQDSFDGRFTYALHNDGTVSVWGYNGTGQLGLGHANNVLTPTINPNFTNVKDIVLGSQHAMVLSETGIVKYTGTNIEGVFGNGDEEWGMVTTPVAITGITAKSIFCNNNHTAIIDTNDNLFVAGKNEFGELIIEGMDFVYDLTQVPNIKNIQLLEFERGTYSYRNANRLIMIINNKVKTFGFSKFVAT